jgi:hypothetical protein
MRSWHNRITQLAFHAVLEEWDTLELLADYCRRNPYLLALRIRNSFHKSFDLHPSPFHRHVGLRAIQFVNWREVSDRLLEMLDTQQHAEKEDPS